MITSLRPGRPAATSHRTRRALGAAIAATASTAALFAATGAASAATSSCAPDGTCTVSFAYTGAPESWTVPANVTSLTVTIAGASGGNAENGAAGGGPGGQFTTTIPVQPGQVLSVAVGGRGADGQDFHTGPKGSSPGGAGGYGGGGNGASAATNSVHITGGGGGGGSFLTAVSGATQTLLATAGGGGASGGSAAGGAGGAGGPGQAGLSLLAGAPDAGGGGTETAGGTAGGTIQVTQPGTGPATSTSAFGTGGSGDAPDPNDQRFGDYPNGGGGGGYYGGGAGGYAVVDQTGRFGSGGGGSGFLASGLAATATSTNAGDGFITLTYQPVRASTGTTLDTSGSPALVGAPVTYTASVFPNPAAGTVAFTDSGTIIPGCGAAPVSAAGTATCMVTYQSAGTHRITASYSGAAGYTPSNSGTLTEQVAYAQQVLSYSATSGRGSVVAVGLRLTDTHGTNLSAANVVVHAVSIDGGPVGHAVISGGSNFPYNRAIRGYAFIAWQDPPGLSKGQHALRFTAGSDPTTHAITLTAR